MTNSDPRHDRIASDSQKSSHHNTANVQTNVHTTSDVNNKRDIHKQSDISNKSDVNEIPSTSIVNAQSVLITGASSGIGKQLAIDYAKEGWHVFACGQNEEKLNQLIEAETTDRRQGLIEPLIFDVTNADEVQTVLGTLTWLPELIILNAGTCEYIENGWVDAALFRRVFDVNVFGMLNCIEAMQSRFTANTHLALMGSTACYVPLPRAEAYGASKAACAYIAHTLAIDLANRGVTVSLISPGFVKTPLTDKNDFAMPLLVSPEYASEKIRQGIGKKKREIHFPRRFSLFMKMLALLPLNIQLAAIKRMTGKTA